MSIIDPRTQNAPEAPRRRILVADADGVARTLIRASLSTEFTIVEARDGNEALDALASPEGFACAIFDDRMPHLSGFDLAEHVRDSAHLRHMPVILVTAKGATLERQFRSRQAGVAAFLDKPFSRIHLERLVNLLLVVRPIRKTA